MKISSYMNNMNPIIEKNDAKVQKENKQANEKHTMEQSVKLSISNDGMEHYRKHIQQNGQETYDDVLLRRELLKSGKISDVDYGYEISKKAAELNKDAANAGKKALSTTDRANGYVAAYAELYDEIVQGYESGTREIYVTDENGTHKLTKYGFILRYPTDQTDVTGIVYEPWHYRYVGKVDKTNLKNISKQSLAMRRYTAP